MEPRSLLVLLCLSLSLSGSPPAAQESPAVPEVDAAPRWIEPGPRWTGRTIVHVARDAVRHRSEMKALGALRRAGLGDMLGERVSAYAADMAVVQEPIVALARAYGAEVVATNWLVNTVGIDHASQALIDALLQRNDVLVIQPDEWHEAQLKVATDAAHHDSDKANTLLTSGGVAIKGGGVTIAIVDSGIDVDTAGLGRPHAAFYPDGNPLTVTGAGIGGSRLLSATSTALFGGTNPDDLCGHGTRIASIAAGAQFNLLPDVDDGPAPNANIRSYKISDAGVGECLASVLSMDAAFQALVAAPDVVVANMSYDGTNDVTTSPNKAIADATLADVFVTLSAGNYGSSLSFAHGSYNALVVGASFVGSKEPLVIPGVATSAIGPLLGRKYPQLLAVGETLTCAKIDDEAGSIDSTGTSGAAAFVAGTAVLVRQAAPSLTALEVRALLLNTSEEIVLGNPNAAGYGYLRSDRAVEDALAGLVVQQTVVTGETRKHPAFLLAGQDAAFTLAWFRETSTEKTIDDLDLRVRDPLGNLIGWSASLLDNTEQIRFTASVPGVYTVEVVPIKFDGDGMAEYALAGVDVLAFDPSTCTPGIPQVASQSPPVAPTLTQALEWPTLGGLTNQVTLTGCNFTGMTLIDVNGALKVVTVIDDNTLTFNLGIPNAIGNLPLTLFGSGGTGTGVLTVAPQNVLATTPTIDISHMEMYMSGPPGDFYAIAFSPDLIPTVVPGLFAVDIGNQAQSLYPAFFGNLNTTNGVQFFNIQGSIAPSSKIHFQGLTLDSVALSPPWTSTNPSTVLQFP